MSKRVYGIDLGTTYSCISVVDDYGQPKILANSAGENTTPSVVYFEGVDSLVVGSSARDAGSHDPENVIEMVKRYMGSEVVMKEVDDTDVVFEPYGIKYKPEEISAAIIRRVVDDAELTEGQSITDVVITCPAYFDTNRRLATRHAGEIAGLTVHEIITEPAAAAIAYGLTSEQIQDDQVVLVYDLGGGTFDTTVVEITDNEINELAIRGDHQLGGKDWDKRLGDLLAIKYAEEKGISADSLTVNEATWHQLMLDAEKMKRFLTDRETTKRRIDHEGDKEQITVTRVEFEEATKDLLDRTIMLTRQVIEDAVAKGMKELDKILLVGGSTFMPQVTQRLEAEFECPVITQDPNHIVAKGAAIYAQKKLIDLIANEAKSEHPSANLASERETIIGVAKELGMDIPTVTKLRGLTVGRVAPKSFGLGVLKDGLGSEMICNNLVFIQAELPAEKEDTFYTVEEGDMVQLTVWDNSYREEDGVQVDLEDCSKIGALSLNFGKKVPKGTPLKARFLLNEDFTLEVEGRDPDTGNSVVEPFSVGVMTKEEVEESHSMLSGKNVS